MKLKSDNTSREGLNRRNQFAWIKFMWHQIAIHVPLSTNKSYQRVILTINRGNGTPVGLDLTNLTLLELQAFTETVALATEIAKPIVERLDLEARKEDEDGNEPGDRFYRPLPTVVIREGALDEHNKELLRRRADVLSRLSAKSALKESAAIGSGSVDEQQQETG